MDLSIIVPVYNVEQHLGRCLDSILDQECDGFELIAVDDGSTDRSREILRAYQSRDPRMVVLEHDRNRKLSVARTTGMSAARGRYVMHVDSDDWLMPGSLVTLLGKLQSATSDVIMFNHIKAWPTGRMVAENAIESEQVVDLEPKFLPSFVKSCWDKVVRRDLLEDMVYHRVALNHSEDFILGLEVFIRATTLQLLPNVLYVYYQNPASLTRTVTMKESIEKRVHALDALRDIKDRYGPCDGILDAALSHQVKWIHKEFALHGLDGGPAVNWEELLRLVGQLDEGNRFPREIARSVRSTVFRIACLQRYWGAKWAISYAVNGLLLPRIGLGWKRAIRQV